MISTAELLDLAPATGGQRAEGFSFDLLDKGRQTLGSLDVSLSSAPRVRFDTSRSIFRTCTGVVIPRREAAAFDPARSRVRARMRLGNGDSLSLGVFMFGDDVRGLHSWGERATPALFDETFDVDQALEQTVGVAPGGSTLALFAQLVGELDLPDFDINVPDQPAATSLVYKAGTSRNQALRALAALLGCFPPFFDNEGTYRLRQAPAPGAPAQHIYETGGRIFAGSVEYSSSEYRAPNRWIVVSDNPSGSIVGIYDLPDAAPNSFANTGRRVRSEKQMQGIASQEIADLAAYVNALTDRNNYTKATFRSAADPRHDGFELSQLYGSVWAETAWEIACSPGGGMTHDLTGFWE